MPNYAVLDNQTNEQINFVVAESANVAPDGCYMVEIPDGYYWNGSAVVEVPYGD